MLLKHYVDHCGLKYKHYAKINIAYVILLFNVVVSVSFKKSSYVTQESKENKVMIMIVLSQPSSKPFVVMISLMDETADSKYLCVMYIEFWTEIFFPYRRK